MQLCVHIIGVWRPASSLKCFTQITAINLRFCEWCVSKKKSGCIRFIIRWTHSRLMWLCWCSLARCSFEIIFYSHHKILLTWQVIMCGTPFGGLLSSTKCICCTYFYGNNCFLYYGLKKNKKHFKSLCGLSCVRFNVFRVIRELSSAAPK